MIKTKKRKSHVAVHWAVRFDNGDSVVASNDLAKRFLVYELEHWYGDEWCKWSPKFYRVSVREVLPKRKEQK